jgi:hypothetical protein
MLNLLNYLKKFFRWQMVYILQSLRNRKVHIFQFTLPKKKGGSDATHRQYCHVSDRRARLAVVGLSRSEKLIGRLQAAISVKPSGVSLGLPSSTGMHSTCRPAPASGG